MTHKKILLCVILLVILTLLSMSTILAKDSRLACCCRSRAYCDGDLEDDCYGCNTVEMGCEGTDCDNGYSGQDWWIESDGWYGYTYKSGTCVVGNALTNSTVCPFNQDARCTW